VLLDFLPLVKLRKSVLNYITKRRKNGLSPGDHLYHVHEETGSFVTQCRNPTLKECEDDIHTPEMGTWESSRTPENLELDFRGQNSLP
jgi:hypothetical protein